MDLFAYIIIECMYLLVHPFIFVNIILPQCMFSGLIVQHWTISWYVLPWGMPPLPFPISSVVYTADFPLYSVKCPLVTSLFRPHLIEFKLSTKNISLKMTRRGSRNLSDGSTDYILKALVLE